MSYSGSLEEQLGSCGFDYPTIIAALEAQAVAHPLTPIEQALLGVSCFRWARLDKAGIHLEAAAATLPASSSAYTEVLLELSAVRLAALEIGQAEALLAQIPPTSSPWLGNLLLRRQAGLSLAKGDVIRGCSLYERAWQGFVAADLLRGKVLTGFYLGATLAYRGDYRRAEHFLEQTISYARQFDQPALLFDALSKLTLTLIYSDDLKRAKLALDEMRSLSIIKIPMLPPFLRAVTLMNEIILARASGHHVRFLTKLAQLANVAQNRPHPEMAYWLGPLILDSLSKIGRHEHARKLLEISVPPGMHRPVAVRLVEAIILTRSGRHQHAADLLEDLVEEAHEAGLRLDLTRANLHLANARYKSGQHLDVEKPLIEGLRGMAALGKNFLLRDDLKAMRGVLRWGRRQHQIRLYIDVLDHDMPSGNHLVIQSLGGFQALLNGQPLSFRLNEQELFLLLIYIYKHPNCSYAELASEVLSEKSPQAGVNYARQAIMLLRQQLGEDTVLTLRDRPNQAAQVRLDRLRVTYDVDALFDALEQRDLAQIFTLYQGRFAPKSSSVYAERMAELIESGVLHILRDQLRRSSPGQDIQRLARHLERFKSIANPTEELEELTGLLESKQQFSSVRANDDFGSVTLPS